jgi:hypothetical protein
MSKFGNAPVWRYSTVTGRDIREESSEVTVKRICTKSVVS